MNRLDQLTQAQGFRQKVGAILQELESHEFEPTIVSALRNSAEQAKKIKFGYSRTKHSKHLPGPDGLARAADIVDKRWGYDTKRFPDETRRFFLFLGRLALVKGLGWGGLWLGARLILRAKLTKFLRDSPPPFQAGNWQDKIGWDAGHIEKL